jgi:hypothetical protein
MSLRSRARSLQTITRLTYQQALARIRSLGSAPARLAERTRWPLTRCDAYLVNPMLDPEHCAASAGGLRQPVERRCQACRRVFFHAPGELLTVCTSCFPNVAAANAVVAGTVEGVCEELLTTTRAEAVVLLGPDGRLIAKAGGAGSHVGANVAILSLASRQVSALRSTSTGVSPGAFDRMLKLVLDGKHLHRTPVAGGGELVVVVEPSRAPGLVVVLAKAAARKLDQLLADGPAGFFFPRRGSGEPGSGAPAQLSAFDGILGRTGKVGVA